MAASTSAHILPICKSEGSFVFRDWNRSSNKVASSIYFDIPQISSRWLVTKNKNKIKCYLDIIKQLNQLLSFHYRWIVLLNKLGLLPSIKIVLNSESSRAVTSKTLRFLATVEIDATDEESNASILLPLSANTYAANKLEKLNTQQNTIWDHAYLAIFSGDFKVSCTLSIYLDLDERPLPIWITPTDHLDNDISELYAEDDLKDFTFKVGDKDFKVHKLVLSRASHLFKTMFICGLDETKLSCTTVEECEPEVFESLLKFIYDGITPENLRSISVHLFELAHRYNIPRLMKICLDDVNMTAIDSFSALKLYELAIKFELKNLMNCAWKHIKE